MNKMEQLNKRNFFIASNVQHPIPKEGFRFARIVQAFGSPFFSSHNTVSDSGHIEIKEWINKMGYTAYDVEVTYYNLSYGFATINMK